MIRLGLCCKFFKEPIKFRTITATYIKKFNRKQQLKLLSTICFDNSQALLKAIDYCAQNHIGCFRVNSQLLPLKTHPHLKYEISQLPEEKLIKRNLNYVYRHSKKFNIRITFHPDQFVVLNSPDLNIIKKSIEELDYQSEISELIGADVITIHAGGAYGDKTLALQRLEKTLSKLKKRIRSYLAIENDDRIYTPKDLLPFCLHNKIPFVYDIHHHRCLPDRLSVQQTTKLAIKTWDREPLFHISSPKQGWKDKNIRWHHDYINIDDFPKEWKNQAITIEVEAKAKELAVKKLFSDLKLSSYNKK